MASSKAKAHGGQCMVGKSELTITFCVLEVMKPAAKT